VQQWATKVHQQGKAHQEQQLQEQLLLAIEALSQCGSFNTEVLSVCMHSCTESIIDRVADL
jgi:hypothetical protein